MILQRSSAQTAAAVLLARSAQAASRLLGRGAGTALPGLIAQRIATDIILRLATQIPQGAVLVSATNGKTTTTRALATIMDEAGLQPIYNATGSNLLRGIATTLVEQANPLGRLAVTPKTIGLFEVDEATLPQAVAQIRPRAVVLGNLARDQLDRYGELDAVTARWREALNRLPEDALVVLNADDPAVASLAPGLERRVVTFGLEDDRWGRADLEHAADAKFCLRCGTKLTYRLAYYGHFGDYRCAGCGWERPRPQVVGSEVTLDGLAGLRMTITAPQGTLAVEVALPGLYNAYNILAAAAAALALGLPPEAVRRGAGRLTAAFGRAERLGIQGRQVYLLLAKNPVGLNALLRTLLSAPRPLHLLFILNDEIADGQDISWIWDADFEVLAGQAGAVVAAGKRAEDMALRLKYAGVGDVEGEEGNHARLLIQRDLPTALDLAVQRVPPGDTLYVLPTYTAMLEIRTLLTRLGYLAPYWKRG
ncbi:MAG: DUF1727 domain-containing protein [Chloroflexi bacterium]|nr:DUF1727 domain-containing protein [Chloroflexota bacterium]